jgi:hypothetical protein
MKSPKEALLYFTGMDFMLEKIKIEEAMLEAKTGQKHNSPFDAGLKTAGIIYKERAKASVILPGLIAARATGAALAYQKIREIRSKRSSK